MSSNAEFGGISFDLPKNQSNVIKVIGVGGGGSNAINHMFQLGINGVDFVICNTDAQALQNSPVPNKIQLGLTLTEGLGAGANPDVGEQSAIESFDEIKNMFGQNTKMVFITAGMGGGTGTGAAPIIAKMAKELDILTVGIVTVPFQFEGKMRNAQAQIGVEKLREEVDSLIVINNNKLREVYGNLGFKAGFSKADEVLATAARGIAEVITHHYTQNIDLRDAKTVLSNSGTAIMGSANASGANRAQEAIMKALDSPLLNDNKISGAKNVLLLIVSGTEEITLDEIGEINDHIQTEAGHSANIIMGVGEDESLGGEVSVTIIATGFDAEQQDEIVNTEAKKIVHTLEEEQKAVQVLSAENVVSKVELPKPVQLNEQVKKAEEPIIRHTLIEDELIPTTEVIKNIDVVYEEIQTPLTNLEQEFVITDVNKSEEQAPQEEQIAFTFDIAAPSEDTSSEDLFEPVQNESKEVVQEQTPERVVFELTDEVSEIEVNDPIAVVPVTEHNKEGIKRYSLDMPEGELDEVSVPTDEIVFETKTIEPVIQQEVELSETEAPIVTEEEIDPFNTSIEETLKKRADERRKKLKEFNYKFRHNAANIDEIEKEPAYKRMGIDINEKTNGAENISRTSLGVDSNDDIQLRSNNSFLHDNVD
ncbi:cell division protein FtsZ [Pseudofulvibacter geojedonensis]|uniref:Cell division protein FtsZ n=1 Tax=Pseudofulvibacter geojedonensis TaxID=1123758 RepID=A0ABW3I0W1_9FLAO